MAQFVYSGIQGSGKSYEVVRNVIVPNVSKGRRIVTNVAGLNYEAICDYCVEVLGSDRARLGEIVCVDHEAIGQANFFPLEEIENPFRLDRPEIVQALEKVPMSSRDEFLAELNQKADAWRNQFIVKGGDVVVLDECWRWYSTGDKLPPGHLKFFRMHRHFLHPETGQCCDIVLIVQDIDDLQRSIKATVEKSFLMKKHTDLGMPDWYVINIYSGRRQTAKTLIEGGINQKYDPKIFALYSSHSQKKEGGASPKEERADKRGNVFNRKIIKYGIPFGILWICGAGWFMWRFFHPADKSQSIVKEVSASPSPSPAVPGVPSAPPKPSRGVSEDWVLVGYFERGGYMTYMVSDGSGRVRFVSDVPGVKFSPAEIEVAMPDKAVVTRWSGPERGKR